MFGGRHDGGGVGIGDEEFVFGGLSYVGELEGEEVDGVVFQVVLWGGRGGEVEWGVGWRGVG